jgi:hypothetical protein
MGDIQWSIIMNHELHYPHVIMYYNKQVLD